MQNGGMSMLLEFKFGNYKSFREINSFQMISAPKQKGLDYSVYKKKIDKKTVGVLCSSVIYGANASGKTNIIGAMDVLRSIILRGHIRNTEEPVISPNTATYVLELIPNSKLKTAEPVVFEISFLDKNRKIDYHLSMDLGTFLNGKYERKIVSEELYVDNKMIFLRNSGIKYGFLNRYIPDVSSKNLDSLKAVADNSLEPTELFLTNGFKNIFSPTLAKQVIDWFDKKFMVIYRADSIKLIKRFVDSQKSSMYVEQTTNEAAKMFGVVSNDLGYFVSDKDSDASLYSIMENGSKLNTLIPAEIFESYGTIRFVNVFPLVISALQTGATLIVDEFDASIHPMALMSIINIFHNDDINKNHAQLIFNTHNPIFLNSNLFRRDEIKFVERSDDTGYSEIYALSDFGTSTEKGVRKHEDYMKNYFVCKYGAIKDIDFSPLFENMNGEQEV